MRIGVVAASIPMRAQTSNPFMARQIHIQYHQVRMRVKEATDRHAAISGFGHIIASASQRETDQPEQLRVIIHDQNLHVHAPIIR
jgi:hypothetical protein